MSYSLEYSYILFHCFRFFEDFLKVPRKHLGAHHSAFNLSGIISEHLEETVWLFRIAQMLSYNFWTNIHFADACAVRSSPECALLTHHPVVYRPPVHPPTVCPLLVYHLPVYPALVCTCLVCPSPVAENLVGIFAVGLQGLDDHSSPATWMAQGDPI